jgi:hypothetical protein
MWGGRPRMKHEYTNGVAGHSCIRVSFVDGKGNDETSQVFKTCEVCATGEVTGNWVGWPSTNGAAGHSWVRVLFVDGEGKSETSQVFKTCEVCAASER